MTQHASTLFALAPFVLIAGFVLAGPAHALTFVAAVGVGWLVYAAA